MGENETAPTSAPTPPSRGFAHPARLLPVGLALVAGAALLYGIAGHSGKEDAGATACAESRAAAERVAPLARGEVAALTVSKTPRPATDITFLDKDGQKRTLADFRGKTVLLNLWATWCVPCREEMPALDRLQANQGGKDFEVVAVNIDTARLDKRQAFLDSAGVKSLGFFADPTADAFQALKQAGKVVGLPTSILVDPQGCELGIMAGPAAWDSPDATKLVSAAVGAKGG